LARYQHIDGNDVVNATLEKERGDSFAISPELIRPITLAAPINIADPKLEMNRMQNDIEDLKRTIKKYEKLTDILVNAEIRTTTNAGERVLQIIEKDAGVERLMSDEEKEAEADK